MDGLMEEMNQQRKDLNIINRSNSNHFSGVLDQDPMWQVKWL